MDICDDEFYFEYVKFEKPIKYPCRNLEWAVGYNGLELGEEIRAERF